MSSRTWLSSLVDLRLPASHGPRDPTRDPGFDLNAFMSPLNSQKFFFPLARPLLQEENFPKCTCAPPPSKIDQEGLSNTFAPVYMLLNL
ncbi:hypothetical protein NPIL_568311 [Nephila pilipes]|uniref:Uncharacterized protein n=1 Tax=Nephila pilipes TaxID=299642 RepID=A0A8X6MFB8_NEPPI|nr:hypothetical protein NPIL_568311 [Nephila pilipes]